jgi:hypothetical protein
MAEDGAPLCIFFFLSCASRREFFRSSRKQPMRRVHPTVVFAGSISPAGNSVQVFLAATRRIHDRC